jgi:Ca2+-binding RTX toxin-like protein
MRASNTILGGAGNDSIRVLAGSTNVDGGPGNDTVAAIIGGGRARVECGEGDDTVVVSRFAGNRRRVSTSGCEHVRAE